MSVYQKTAFRSERQATDEEKTFMIYIFNKG